MKRIIIASLFSLLVTSCSMAENESIPGFQVMPDLPSEKNTVFHSSISKSLNCIAFGDSITSGQIPGIKPWISILSDYYGFSLKNKAVCSTGYTDGIFETPIKDSIYNQVKGSNIKKYDFVVIAGGQNDWCAGTDLTEFRESVSRTFDLVYQKSSHVVIVLPLIVSEEFYDNWDFICSARYPINDYRDILFEEANQREFSIIDASEFVDIERSDGLHPTQEGHQTYATHIINMIYNYNNSLEN